MNISIIPVSIGAVAAEVLKGSARLSVRGITSRGVFISVEDRVILFLSREKYKGPLIINLLWKNPRLDRLDLSSTGRITDGGLQFEDPEILINGLFANVWSTQDQLAATPLSRENLKINHIGKFLKNILDRTENDFISGVYSALSTTPIPSPVIDAEVYANIHSLFKSLKKKDTNGLDSVIAFFAGRGRGLTPAGDDFLLGLIFGLYSFRDSLPVDYAQLMGRMVEVVQQRSTLISANLVECASLGEIDERLLAAYAYLVGQGVSSDETIKSILSWGSSSGLDATAGMALLLAAISI